jgi:hypothetical protein
LAFRALSVHDPELMKKVTVKVQKRLRDPDPSVVGAALIVSTDAVCESMAASRPYFAHDVYRVDFRQQMTSKEQ